MAKSLKGCSVTACLFARASAFFLLYSLCFISLRGQDASPTVTFYDEEDEEDVEMSPGDSETAPAPLSITCQANPSSEGYSYVCEWRIYDSDEGEDSPFLTRFDEDITYTLTASGGYGIKLYITFSLDGDTVEYESDAFSIVISESSLSCPDGFSPNGDGINDTYNITCESIVKVSGCIFNRWGKKLHTFTVDNIGEGWDGMVGGKVVKDGVYFLNLDAVGSDGLHYQIKKAINVLKGYRESDSSTTSSE